MSTDYYRRARWHRLYMYKMSTANSDVHVHTCDLTPCSFQECGVSQSMRQGKEDDVMDMSCIGMLSCTCSSKLVAAHHTVSLWSPT